MKYLVTLFILLAATICFAADPLEDEFSAASLSSDWTEYGSGSVTVSGGYLEIVPGASGTTGIYQENITGDFDIYARIGSANNIGPPNTDIDSANEVIKIFAYVTNNADEVEIYQNFDSTPGKNEHHALHYNTTWPYVKNAELDASEYWCYRISRVGSTWTSYYNAAEDCSGAWTEHNPVIDQTDDTGTVTIGLEAQENGVTFKADFFRCVGTCSSVSGGDSGSITGVTISSLQINP